MNRSLTRKEIDLLITLGGTVEELGIIRKFVHPSLGLLDYIECNDFNIHEIDIEFMKKCLNDIKKSLDEVIEFVDNYDQRTKRE